MCLASLNVLGQGGENARMSKKILDLARDQQDEVAREAGREYSDDEEEEPERWVWTHEAVRLRRVQGSKTKRPSADTIR